MSDPQQDTEIVRLQSEVASLQARLARRDQDIARLQTQIQALEARIERLKEEREFFKTQSNLNLAENQHLRDRVYGNPYPDRKYNEE